MFTSILKLDALFKSRVLRDNKFQSDDTYKKKRSLIIQIKYIYNSPFDTRRYEALEPEDVDIPRPKLYTWIMHTFRNALVHICNEL